PYIVDAYVYAVSRESGHRLRWQWENYRKVYSSGGPVISPDNGIRRPATCRGNRRVNQLAVRSHFQVQAARSRRVGAEVWLGRFPPLRKSAARSPALSWLSSDCQR